MKKKKKKIGWKIFGIVCLLICGIGGYFFFTEFHLEKIKVTGNTRYTTEEMIEIVDKKYILDNTIFMCWFSRIKPIENIPFIDKIQISYRNRHEIEVEVYEMAIAGCIEDMGNYVYFDYKGNILESSSEKLENIPVIEGLDFQQFILHEKLPVKKEKDFQQILLITQLIQENMLEIEKVRFSIGENIILYQGDLKIQLGNKEYLEEKMMNLPEILKKANGMKGTIHMEEYGNYNKIVTFTPEKLKKNSEKNKK